MMRQPNGVAGAALRFFENRYLLTLALTIIVMAGYSALTNMPRIEDPRIINRFPRIVTFLPGASAERVEALVTDRLEDSLREMSGIRELRSTSRAGVSVLQVELQDYIGPGENQQVFSKMRDRLNDAAALLPDGASPPDFNDKNSAVAFSMVVAVSWRGSSDPPLGAMNRLGEDLADSFRALAGTDHVELYGAPEEEIAVTVDGEVLSSMGLTPTQVAAGISGADVRLPAGALRNAERKLFLEVGGELVSVDRVRQVPLATNPDGAVVQLGDVALVSKSWRDPPAAMAYSNGRRSVLVAAHTRRDIRVDQWADTARAAVANFAATQAAGVDVNIVFDQSRYTQERLSTLGGNLLAGAVIVMLVVLAGMGWRAAIVVGMALPLSASLTVFGLDLLGQQIHQMTIFGMIIAIGLLIDNAIVMTDEIRKTLEAGAARPDAVRGALSQLFIPLLASTLTTVLGFMPVYLLPGAMGDFVGPIATSVVLALSASFFLAVTIIPAMAGLFLRRPEPGARRKWWRDGCNSERLSTAYRHFLDGALARPAVTLTACLVLPVSGFVLAATLGQEFFPPADRDQFEIEVWMPPDSSIQKTAMVARAIEKQVCSDPGVAGLHWMIGGSFPTIYYNRIMNQEGNDAYAQAMVYTRSPHDAKRLTGELQATLADTHPDARIVVSPFAQGPPVDAPVGFRINGPGTATLKSLGDELRRIMHNVPGIVATGASITGGQPKLSFNADEIAASQVGLSLTDVAAQLQGGMEGRIGGMLLEDLEALPVRVRFDHGGRDNATSVASLSLVGGTGRRVPAASVGAIELTPESGSITRREGVRSNDVLGYIHRDSLAIDVTKAVLVRADAEGFSVPPGYTFAVAGDSAEQSEALGDLTTYLPILLMLMIATIVLSFRSTRLALLIGTVAVLSVGLGMLSLWAGGYARGFNAIIGSVGLVGVAINGTIVVLAAIRANPDARRGDRDAIIDETVAATRHIVSTTLTTVGGFVPLLLFTGGDFWPPLAIVIAGGVALSISLSLVFTPTVYTRLGAMRVRTAGSAWPARSADRAAS